nr:MAG TPA: hypothetical protein [Caudoviricetes sp.]
MTVHSLWSSLFHTITWIRAQTSELRILVGEMFRAEFWQKIREY